MVAERRHRQPVRVHRLHLPTVRPRVDLVAEPLQHDRAHVDDDGAGNAVAEQADHPRRHSEHQTGAALRHPRGGRAREPRLPAGQQVERLPYQFVVGGHEVDRRRGRFLRSGEHLGRRECCRSHHDHGVSSALGDQ
jgi:hypothetical protein